MVVSSVNNKARPVKGVLFFVYINGVNDIAPTFTPGGLRSLLGELLDFVGRHIEILGWVFDPGLLSDKAK
jgi:hypothetical protein